MSATFRSRLKGLGILLGLALLLAWLGWRLAQPPHLMLTDLSGRPVSIPPRQGLMLVNFWATTCPACLREIPVLVRLHRRFGAKGLKIVGVAMPYDRPDRVVRFARDYPLPYTVALDPAGAAADAFGVRFTPAWILVAPRGRIVWRHTGYVDEAELARLIETRLSS
ncbi:hypothetical protein MIN45_P1114 [Methylomarinovum tepidoasis]|uniref:Thioredoxin domain-containing protein n=1 Tax=Methylomarinovum tepidoasis TaxID=2840183 RepID=A0AAU9BYD1_9GAMM|nr:TlpA disulfide reductase family protein [Methylomarinovum sp. IN45]BCX88745.1 hypothetical protein MIN45_P1114 [Methylomarinovum sp. IN45]